MKKFRENKFTMKLKKKEANNEVVDVFTKFLSHNNHRKTPERFSILNEIRSEEHTSELQSQD